MKAAYYEGQESIRVGEYVPTVPGDGQVQLKVAYCGICGTDLHVFHGHMDTRVSVPQPIGHEMSGTIAGLGPNVMNWAVGERVAVRPLQPCGSCPACRAGHSHICHNLKFIGIDTPGALQSYWTVPAYTLHRLPAGLSLRHGALIEPLAVACHDVRRGEVKGGDYVVVLGGGPIGALIGLLAAQQGARVLVSEIKPFRLELLRRLGLETINPLDSQLVDHVMSQTNGAGADVVFEVSASPSGAEVMTQLARTRGRLVVVGIFSKPPQVNLHRVFWRELELRGARVYEPEDFEMAIRLAASGTLPLDSLITDVRPLEGLEKSFRQMEGSEPVMKILIQVE